jgi:opacity protein-like surface antigen
VTIGIEENLSSKTIAFTEYTGYSADYDKTNYRLGLNFEYGLKNAFSINSAFNYSNKDYTGTYYCAVCDFAFPPSPENIDFRFLEIPLTLRYYFFPNKTRIFTELGLNNHIVLTNAITDKSYGLGIKFGGGIEYNLTQNIALQMLIDYNKGITNSYDESNFKVDYMAFGIGVMKRL